MENRMELEDFAEFTLSLIKKKESEIRQRIAGVESRCPIDSASVRKAGRAIFLTGRWNSVPELLVVADYDRVMPSVFSGTSMKLSDGGVARVCGWTAENAAALRLLFPWTSPILPDKKNVIRCRETIDFPSDDGLFPLFVLRGEPFCEAANRLVFECFRSGYRAGYGVECVASAAAPPCRLPGGIPLLLLKLDVPGNRVVPEEETRIIREYGGRTFVVAGGRALRFTPELAASCARKYFPSFERLLLWTKKMKIGLGVWLPASSCSCEEHLFVSRELRRRNIRCDWISSEAGGDPALHRAVSLAYGETRWGENGIFL